MTKRQIIPTQDDIDRAEKLFQEGAEAWKQGRRGEAMSLYSRSAALNPEGPGAQAYEMTRQIMDFYDTQQFNP